MCINCDPSKAHQRHSTLRNWRKICAGLWKGIVRETQYDRQKHDPVEDVLHVTAPLVIVEGNWLLLDDEKWCQLAQFCDFSIFIKAPASALRERLVGRKLAGGLSLADAEAFYDRTDGPNVRRVLEESLPANLTLMMTATGEYRLMD